MPIPLKTIVAPLMVGHHRRAVTITAAIWLPPAALPPGLWLAEPVVIRALEWLGLTISTT